MSKRKIYKLNKRQLKVIVESQKNSPQLQTEILDRTAEEFGKLLSWSFRQSVNAFKYFSGVRVNVFYGDQFTPTGKYPVKKNNPLAPLSIYKSTLVGLPQNYQNLFTTLYHGINIFDDIKNNETNTISSNQKKPSYNENNISLIDKLFNKLKFDDVENIVYQIKFQFQNLKKDAKENAELMMTTWSLTFNVECEGNVTDENNTMKWELVGFNSQGPSISRFLSMASSKDKENEGDRLLKTLSKFAGMPTNQLSLIFTNQRQANKFAKAMKNQIEDHMKIIIGQVNAKLGFKNIIKQPKVTVIVNPRLIGDYSIQPQINRTYSKENIENDIKEVIRQIQFYNNQDQYKDYVSKLKIILNRLLLLRKAVSKKE